jgi:hypothetical protein
MTIHTTYGEIELKKGALAHADIRNGNLHVKACSSPRDVVVFARGHKITLPPGQEVTVLDHIPTQHDLHPSDGVGRRNQETRSLVDGAHIVLSDFSIISMLGALNVIRANQTIVSRVLKTAAAVDVLTRSKGAYFAIPREASSPRFTDGQATAKEHVKPVSYSAR